MKSIPLFTGFDLSRFIVEFCHGKGFLQSVLLPECSDRAESLAVEDELKNPDLQKVLAESTLGGGVKDGIAEVARVADALKDGRLTYENSPPQLTVQTDAGDSRIDTAILGYLEMRCGGCSADLTQKIFSEFSELDRLLKAEDPNYYLFKSPEPLLWSRIVQPATVDIPDAASSSSAFRTGR
jgi:hypothetical protein